MIGKKIAAMAMSAVLVVSLSPGLALANTLEAGQAQTQAPKTVSTQAAKKTVYVLDWYDYNSNGLLKSYAGYDIKYKGINMKSATETYTTGGYYDDDDNYVPGTKKVTYKYTMKSSNGRVKSATYKSSTSKITSKYNYSYNGSGNLVSEKYTYKVPHLYGAKSKKVKTYYTSTTNYTLKKGRPVSAQTTTKNADGSKSVGVKTKYAYDGKGNLKKISENKHADETRIYKNKYTKGNLTKRTVKYGTYYSSDGSKYGGSSYDNTYEWKAIKVPKSAVKAVKAQQWALLNRNLNGALGPLY